MALITPTSRFIIPEAYFGCSHGHIAELKLESGTVSAQVEPWSKIDVNVTATKFRPNENKLETSTGREYTYKSLVVATGFDHKSEFIPGLEDFEGGRGENKVFTHLIDRKSRAVDRNYYHGWMHTNGDMINYYPKLPYKGEGTDFYSLYYEHYVRQDILQGRAAKNARVQVWTPNKQIFDFPYANEVALDECHKRGIDVFFGWEMVEMKSNEHDEKICVFKNVDTGETIEKDCQSAVINPPSKPHQALVDGGLTNSEGLVDVNPYTLQHKRFENVFAFGDCIDVNTTRTQTAAWAQCPIVKHNVKNFLDGKELNAIYDGYTYMPLVLGHSYATCFQHLHDFEPHWKNHFVPHYGLFSRYYFGRMIKSGLAQGTKYSSFKKNVGPPHYQFNPRYVPLEHNEYLQGKGVGLDEVKMFEPKVHVEPVHH